MDYIIKFFVSGLRQNPDGRILFYPYKRKKRGYLVHKAYFVNYWILNYLFGQVPLAFIPMILGYAEEHRLLGLSRFPSIFLECILFGSIIGTTYSLALKFLHRRYAVVNQNPEELSYADIEFHSPSLLIGWRGFLSYSLLWVFMGMVLLAKNLIWRLSGAFLFIALVVLTILLIKRVKILGWPKAPM
jgi:hypothetical protein